MILSLHPEEFYPVLSSTGLGEPADVPDDLATRFLAAEQEFWQVQFLLQQYLRAVEQEQEANEHQIDIVRRRLSRGRRRHFRRARPQDV